MSKTRQQDRSIRRRRATTALRYHRPLAVCSSPSMGIIHKNDRLLDNMSSQLDRPFKCSWEKPHCSKVSDQVGSPRHHVSRCRTPPVLLRQPTSANPPLCCNRDLIANLIWHGTTESTLMSDLTTAISPTVGRASYSEAHSPFTNARIPARSRTSAGTTVAIRNSQMYACCS